MFNFAKKAALLGVFAMAAGAMFANTSDAMTAKAKKDGCCAEKSDVYYGSRKGGFAISFGATPVINFVGNMFNGNTKNEFEGFKGLSSDLFGGLTMSGKYMVADKWAVTLNLGFDNSSKTSYSYKPEEHKSDEKVQSTTKTASREVMVMVGGQYLLRPGKRLQPVLGLNLVYVYGNSDFTKYSNEDDSKLDKTTGVPSHTIGLLGNVGVEYFICRNISLSATVDLGVARTMNRKKLTVDSDADSYNQKDYKETTFKTGQFGGNLGLNFYF